MAPTTSLPSRRTDAEHLRLLLSHSDVGAWELDVRSGSAWRNLRHEQIFGYDDLQPEWTYGIFLGHVVPDERAGVDALYGSALRERKPWSFECRIDRADGERRWITATGKPVRDEDGEVTHLIGHVIDITHVKRNEERLRTITHELNHRVKNTLMVVQSIAMRSFPDDRTTAEGRKEFVGRIQALAATHALLTEQNWLGAQVTDVVRDALAPYCAGKDAACAFEGPEAWLPAKTAVNLSMAINELATNAVKHGALSRPEGRVRVGWSCEPSGEDTLCTLTWTERGGPPVSEPQGNGFGMTLIGGLLPSEPGGAADVRFEPGGLIARLAFLTQRDAFSDERR